MSTPGTIKRRTLLTGTNNPAYQVSKDVYNDSLVIASAAANNSLMARDATQADGWGFLTLGAGLAVIGGALTVSGAAAAGLDTQVQFNDAGAIAGDAGLVYNKTTDTLTAGVFAGSGASLTNLPAANLTGALPAISGASLTNLPAANLTGILAAISGANLTSLNATQLTSGTIPDARFPVTLPAASGVNLTALNATELTSGTIPSARVAAGAVTQHQTSLTIAETQITDGALLARVGGNETITGTWIFSNRITGPDGTSALPTYGFTNDPNTGIASGGADAIIISVGGTPRLYHDANVTTLGASNSLNWSPNTSALTGTPDVTLARGGIGLLNLRSTSPSVGAALNFIEQADPAAPAANQAVVYCKDNGAGKSQIVARFPSGAVQVMATEP